VNQNLDPQIVLIYMNLLECGSPVYRCCA